ncbi:DUF2507 domain-containing protein [Virgibacillus sp. MG-45]|uniref:DUF2507 domain-containing protein n=1 Tax=Virgibacillus sp. MG-45 TaxID=3102791 RepID=UPI002EDA8856
MTKKQNLHSLSILDNLHTSGAGYDVLRYLALPELLGKEKDSLLYFMGKSLARNFEFQAFGDILYFFETVGWGKLELIKEKRKELVFYMMSDAVARRLTSDIQAEFRLEAGFLAEAIQAVKGIECECMEEVNYKIHQVEFKVVFTD